MFCRVFFSVSSDTVKAWTKQPSYFDGHFTQNFMQIVRKEFYTVWGKMLLRIKNSAAILFFENTLGKSC